MPVGMVAMKAPGDELAAILHVDRDDARAGLALQPYLMSGMAGPTR